MAHAYTLWRAAAEWLVQTLGQRELLGSEKLVQKLVGVQNAAKVRDATHEQQRDALGVL